MKLILGILFFVIFGVIGMRIAGDASTALVGARTFQSPDEVDQFLLLTNLGISAAFATVGAIVGVLIARWLKSKAIRTEA